MALTLFSFVKILVLVVLITSRSDASVVVKRAPALATNIPKDSTYQGCYSDSIDNRALSQLTTASDTMTELTCLQYCSANKYPYAGVEYSRECFCGSVIASTSVKGPEGDCNMPCTGNANELCGGPNRLNVFRNTSITGPTTNPGPTGWGFLGCYVDSINSRSLPVAAQVQGAMTVAGCTTACKNQGYSYAGVEYGVECYCGNSIVNSLLAPDGLAGCNMPCNGNSNEYCGGSNRLDVYQFGKTVSSSTSTTTTASRTTTTVLTTITTKPTTTTSSTTTKPTTTTTTSTTTKPITTTTTSTTTTKLTTTTTTTTTTKPTTTTTTRTTTTRTTTTVVTTTTSKTTTTTTTTSATPSASNLPSGWTYRGCWVDGANGRILKEGPNSATLTTQSCISGCKALGYSIAGTEYTTECFCGNYVANGGKLAASDSECNMVCRGDESQTCGGPSRVSLYATGDVQVYAVPVAKTSNLPGSWKYVGCVSDSPQKRTLPYQIDMPTNLTISNCLNQCAKFGYSAAAMEWGQQCFCGDDADRLNAGATILPAGQCNTYCPGEPDALCGGTNAMNFYTWPDLTTWVQATGNAAGQYNFLIGGPVIPLITQVQINGKVLFSEKHGTSLTPNSTGAFEFDISKVNNYNQAWRELQGLQTDIFCSAALTLPDKAGRVINIAGWALSSTFGLRFYTPDGFNGQTGKNGWEENVDTVHLLNGRWYPSAMQMVNGSILVVGGQDGANGVAVPTLEVIPTPAGVTQASYMDWLKRTDPYNLYPFLCVLPSGNIAVFYYNEARILDARTFATLQTLPNIPGAVNNPLGGRTYPLEGTALLLPQSAPYTDPLSVIICGGSTPYGGNALDNCVTIQPEAPGSQWTIERMPSRRVISCMVALPDGTYLILNGARKGVAGFGTSEDPNREALLYDPLKPLNRRITRMANTTIDRLYHSEAILLQDGRVLVSGSDPEDNPETATVVHAQEYRVEVFIPPYLMGTRANKRPDFNFKSGVDPVNLGYGQSFQVYVNSTVSKVSLMAAVASTHGNSMGQRTILPAFSCANDASGVNGYTTLCTITTPPNGGITGGPGWHMVFVMDSAGTPSVAKWVRIGGDPAGLGNWPNAPGFTRPGV